MPVLAVVMNAELAAPVLARTATRTTLSAFVTKVMRCPRQAPPALSLRCPLHPPGSVSTMLPLTAASNSAEAARQHPVYHQPCRLTCFAHGVDQAAACSHKQS
jgi:hypothetical protein